MQIGKLTRDVKAPTIRRFEKRRTNRAIRRAVKRGDCNASVRTITKGYVS